MPGCRMNNCGVGNSLILQERLCMPLSLCSLPCTRNSPPHFYLFIVLFLFRPLSKKGLDTCEVRGARWGGQTAEKWGTQFILPLRKLKLIHQQVFQSFCFHNQNQNPVVSSVPGKVTALPAVPWFALRCSAALGVPPGDCCHPLA